MTSASDRTWFAANNFLLVAWSALGRGFFARSDPNDRSDKDLVRVFYSSANFERKRRAGALAAERRLSMFDIALGYVINQDFPVVALNGARTPEQVIDSLKAAELRLSKPERDWLDLTSDQRPFWDLRAGKRERHRSRTDADGKRRLVLPRGLEPLFLP